MQFCPIRLKRILLIFLLITQKIFDNAINFAKTHINMSDDILRTIKHCQKSLHFFNEEAWKKNITNDCFDATMGSLDGAEVYELVGLYILDSLSRKLIKTI